jgi:N utilization substance protein A
MTREELDEQIERAIGGFCSIEGVDATLAEKLVAEGYMSYDDLSIIEPDALMEMGGLTEEQVEAIVEQAEARAQEAEAAAAEERRRQREQQRIDAATAAIDAQEAAARAAAGESATTTVEQPADAAPAEDAAPSEPAAEGEGPGGGSS